MAFGSASSSSTATSRGAKGGTAGSDAPPPSPVPPETPPADVEELLRAELQETCDSRVKVAPTLPEDSAPFAPLASLEAESRPQQPQATAQRLSRQRGRMEGGGRGPSN